MYRLLLGTTNPKLIALVIAEFTEDVNTKCMDQTGHPSLYVLSWQKTTTTENDDSAEVIDIFSRERVA